MKRSEVVKRISSKLKAELGSQKVLIDLDLVAAKVLEVVEKAGMLPPLSFLETFNKYDNGWETE